MKNLPQYIVGLLSLVLVLLGGPILADSPSAAASAAKPALERFVEGKHYQRVPSDVSRDPLVQDLIQASRDKVKVLEFFSYGCSWCYKLDPFMEKWQKSAPSFVSFERIPVEFQASWGTLTKAYYTALELNALDKIHSPLFEAVHSEKITNSAEDTLRGFFVSRGIAGQEFTRVFDSSEVAKKQKWAASVARACRVTFLPAVMVEGPKGIFVTTVWMAGSEENLLKVLDYLVMLQHENRP